MVKVICNFIARITKKIDDVLLSQEKIEHLEREILKKESIIRVMKCSCITLSREKNELARRLLSEQWRKEQAPTQNVKGITGLTSEDIRSLINLCHPDKHGGKSVAIEMTQKLLELRGRK